MYAEVGDVSPFDCRYFDNFVISNPNIDFLYQRIVQSWFASMPSVVVQIILYLENKKKWQRMSFVKAGLYSNCFISGTPKKVVLLFIAQC